MVAISCEAGAKIIYQKTLLRDGLATTLTATYPTSEKAIWDPIVASDGSVDDGGAFSQLELALRPEVGFEPHRYFEACAAHRGLAVDLQTISSITGIISSIAVTLSLVFLIVSIRQNTNSQKVLAVQSLASSIAALNIPAMESSAIGEALVATGEDWKSATREQRILAHFFLFSYFKLAETAWYQHQAGVLESAQWNGWESVVRSFYHADGVKRGWWPHIGTAYSPAFAELSR